MRESDLDPRPPYFAVIFTSARATGDDGYAETAARMIELAQEQSGFLGVESAGDASAGITVSYWRSREDIAAWKSDAEHREAQRRGRAGWYRQFKVRIARVERAYEFHLPVLEE